MHPLLSRRALLAAGLAALASPALSLAKASRPRWHPDRPYDASRDGPLLDAALPAMGREQFAALSSWIGPRFVGELPADSPPAVRREYHLTGLPELNLLLAGLRSRHSAGYTRNGDYILVRFMSRRLDPKGGPDLYDSIRVVVSREAT